MPASMMIADAGGMENVIGSSSDIAATGPGPGSTPTTMPRRTPRNADSRSSGCRATIRPSSTPTRSHPPDQVAGQRDVERQCEQAEEAGRRGRGHARRDQPALATEHPDPEQQQEE